MDVTALDKVRKLNIGAGTLHLISAILIVVLANSFALPVVARYMAGPPGSGKYQMVAYGSVSMALLIAVFFLLSALAHFSVAGPRWRTNRSSKSSCGMSFFSRRSESILSSCMAAARRSRRG